MLAAERPSSSAEADFLDALRAARAGDDEGFAVLFREWNPPLLRFLRARAPGVADDLASDVWMTAAGKIAQFEGGLDAWRAWLFTLAHRRLIDHRRQAERRRTDLTAGDVFAHRSAVDDPAQEASDRLSAQEAIDGLVAALTPEQAEVILLRVVAGLDAAQVAKIVGRTAGWVRVTQHRALRRLSESYALDKQVAG